MKKILALSILVSILVIASIVMVSADSGRVWTTRSDCITPQNENHYYPEEHVWIKAAGFDSLTEYDWRIVGLPENNNESGASCDAGKVVINGTNTTDSNGGICFDAYIVQPGDCGEYKAYFDGKKDNYRVIPEFGLVIGGLTLIGAVGIFFFVRRK